MKKVLESKTPYFWLFGLILLIAISLRLDLFLFNRSFWFDEAALAMNVLSCDFGGLFLQLAHYQSAPPMFLFETKILTRLFGESEYVFRALPFLISLFSLPLYNMFLKYFIKSSHIRLLALFLFAINTNLIFYSSEFKPYAFDVFCAIVLPLLLLRFRLKYPVLLGILFSLCLWYSHASAIVEFALVLLLLFVVIKNKKSFKNFLLFVLPQGINFLLFSLHMAQTSNIRAFMTRLWSQSYIAPDFSNFSKLFLDNIFYIFHPYKFIPAAFPYFLPLVFGIICLFGAVFLYRQNKFKFLLLLTPYFTLVLLAYFHLYPYYDRVTLFLTPAFIILFAKFFEFSTKIFKKRQKYAAALILLLFMTFSIYPVYTSQKVAKNLPSQDRAMFLELKQNYKKDDVIILNQTSLPQFLYYSRRNDFSVPKNNLMVEKLFYSQNEHLFLLRTLDENKKYWFMVSSVKFPNVIDTRETIEFWGINGVEFTHKTKGKTDLYHVAK